MTTAKLVAKLEQIESDMDMVAVLCRLAKVKSGYSIAHNMEGNKSLSESLSKLRNAITSFKHLL